MRKSEAPTQNDRLSIRRFADPDDTNTFARDVREGLTSVPKVLPPKYFYDELGSYLFEAICCLPEYYVARDEHEILEKYSTEIIESIDFSHHEDIELIELGSGNAEKTRRLIAPLLDLKSNLHYVPIDISETSLARSSEELLQAYEKLRITGYAGDYSTVLEALTPFPRSDHLTSRTVVSFLGTSIGNLEPDGSIALLKEVRRLLGPGDVMLVGADLKKSADVLLPAYNDALNITAAFNLNLLVRINRELGGEFDITQFRHSALYNEELSRIEMHIVSREVQRVRIKALNIEIDFFETECIHTENSYKFDSERLIDLGAKSGFSLEKTWYDSNRRFSLNLFSVR